MTAILRWYQAPGKAVLEKRMAERLKEIVTTKQDDFRNATILSTPEPKKMAAADELRTQSFIGRNIGAFQTKSVFKEKERLLEPFNISALFSQLSSSTIDKDEFDDVLCCVSDSLEELKNQRQDDDEPYEFLKASIAQSRCSKMAKYFPLLDNDFDGAIETEKVKRLLQVVINGTTHEELDLLFDIFDVDQDGMLSEVELVHLMRDQMDATESALVELVGFLPESNKKMQKLFRKFLTNALFDQIQVPNKIRCVFHWSDKRLDDLITKKEFLASQKDNFSEYSNLHLLVTDNFEQSLVKKGEDETEFRRDMGASIAFIIAVGVVDVFLFFH